MGQYRDTLRLAAGLMGAGMDPMQGLDMYLSATAARDERMAALKAQRQQTFGQLLTSGVQAAEAGTSFPQIQAQLEAVAPALGARPRMIDRAVNRIENKVFPYGTEADSPSIFSSMWDQDDEALVGLKIEELVKEDQRFLSDRAATRAAIREEFEQTLGPELYEQLRGNIDQAIDTQWAAVGGIPQNVDEGGPSAYDRIQAEQMGMTPLEYEHRDDGWIKKWGAEPESGGFMSQVGDVVEGLDDFLLFGGADDLSKTFWNPDTGEFDPDWASGGKGLAKLGAAAAIDLVGGPIIGKLGGAAIKRGANVLGRLGGDEAASAAAKLFGLDEAAQQLVGKQFGHSVGDAVSALRTAVPGKAGLERMIPGGNFVSDIVRGRSAQMNPFAAVGALGGTAVTGGLDNAAAAAAGGFVDDVVPTGPFVPTWPPGGGAPAPFADDIGGFVDDVAPTEPFMPTMQGGGAPAPIADEFVPPPPMMDEPILAGGDEFIPSREQLLNAAAEIPPGPAGAAELMGARFVDDLSGLPLAEAPRNVIFARAQQMMPEITPEDLTAMVEELPPNALVSDLDEQIMVFKSYLETRGDDWVRELAAPAPSTLTTSRRPQPMSAKPENWPVSVSPEARLPSEGKHISGFTGMENLRSADDIARTTVDPAMRQAMQPSIYQTEPMPRWMIRRPNLRTSGASNAEEGKWIKNPDGEWIFQGSGQAAQDVSSAKWSQYGMTSPYQRIDDPIASQFTDDELRWVAEDLNVEPEDLVRRLNYGQADPEDVRIVLEEIRPRFVGEGVPPNRPYSPPQAGLAEDPFMGDAAAEQAWLSRIGEAEKQAYFTEKAMRSVGTPPIRTAQPMHGPQLPQQYSPEWIQWVQGNAQRLAPMVQKTLDEGGYVDPLLIQILGGAGLIVGANVAAYEMSQ